MYVIRVCSFKTLLLKKSFVFIPADKNKTIIKSYSQFSYQLNSYDFVVFIFRTIFTKSK